MYPFNSCCRNYSLSLPWSCNASLSDVTDINVKWVAPKSQWADLYFNLLLSGGAGNNLRDGWKINHCSSNRFEEEVCTWGHQADAFDVRQTFAAMPLLYTRIISAIITCILFSGCNDATSEKFGLQYNYTNRRATRDDQLCYILRDDRSWISLLWIAHDAQRTPCQMQEIDFISSSNIIKCSTEN